MPRPGGSAIITTPNANNYFGGHSGNPFHFKEYRREELIACFSEIIDPRYFKVLATSDVPSTVFRNNLRRSFKNKQLGIFLGRWLGIPISMLERAGVISVAPARMIKGERDNLIGGFMAEIQKP